MFMLLAGIQAVYGENIDSVQIQMIKLERLNQLQRLDNTGKLSLGRIYFYLAVENKEYIEKGEILFQELNTPTSEYKGEAQMYMAALEAIRAKNALWPSDKWSIANSALSKMDKTVSKYPENVEVRFIRASTCYYLPFFFNRKEQVKQDFVFLAQRIPQRYKDYPKELIGNMCEFIVKSDYLGGEVNDRMIEFQRDILNRSL